MGPDAERNVFKGRATVHDQSQFEVTFTYDVSAPHLAAGQEVEHYRIEAFYFFPTNMGVTALTFSKEDFYRSLHGYIRFKTPTLQAAALINSLNGHSPLNVLAAQLRRIIAGNALKEEEAAHEARLFGCVTSRLLTMARQELDTMLQSARSNARSKEHALECALMESLRTLPQLLDAYRALLLAFQAWATQLSPLFLNHLAQVDEYLTYRFDHTLSAMQLSLAEGNARGFYPELLLRIKSLAESENQYRIRKHYIQLTPGDAEALALYTYRSSALKKLVEQVLYLDVKTVQENVRWRNLAALAGAMAAAIWATSYNGNLFGGYNAVSLMRNVNFWFGLVLFVVLYGIKDRLKDALRDTLWARFSRFFPDNRLLIHDPTKKIDIGYCKERTRYLLKREAPAGVLRVRNSQHAIDLDSEREETVIAYQNDVFLNVRDILSGHKRRTHIKHILRFSVDSLLGRLDDPTALVQFYDAASRSFCRVQAHKVYHLNVVFRFTRWDARKRSGEPYYQRIRVILDKNGIQRVESVTDLWSSEQNVGLVTVSAGDIGADETSI